MPEENLPELLAQILARLSAIKDGQTKLRSDLMARMDRLQARIDQLGDEAFVTYAQYLPPQGLQDQVSGLVRQMRRMRQRLDALEDKA